MIQNADDITKDRQTVKPDGEEILSLPHGVRIRDAVTHVDDRGSLFEGYDPRWNWHPAPLVYAYFVTIRPGVTKGWAYHQHHEDRYFIIKGEMMVVLYDDRPDSPTRGMVSEIVLSHFRRQMLLIPTHVWHADQNIGEEEVVLANFPTQPYDHKNPDKYRLPLDTDKIPYKFKNTYGW